MSGCNVSVNDRILHVNICTRVFTHTPRVSCIPSYIYIICYPAAILYMLSLSVPPTLSLFPPISLSLAFFLCITLSFPVVEQYTGTLRKKLLFMSQETINKDIAQINIIKAATQSIRTIYHHGTVK